MNTLICFFCEKPITETMKKCPHCYTILRRDVGILLVLAIIFMPLLFSWITLLKGYSSLSRVASFVWLVAIVMMLITSYVPT